MAKKLQDVISRTARENQTHSFVPHVTVAGPIQNKTGEEALKALQDVAKTLPVRGPPPLCAHSWLVRCIGRIGFLRMSGICRLCGDMFMYQPSSAVKATVGDACMRLVCRHTLL